MILGAAVLALVIGALVAATDLMRDQAKTVRARKLLRALAVATEVYARLPESRDEGSTGADRTADWPPGSFDAAATPGLAALLAVPQTREILTGAGWPWNGQLDKPAAWLDPWGRPLRYVTALHNQASVRMNGGRPYWVCAGPNGRFGDDDPRERADNISTDEPL